MNFHYSIDHKHQLIFQRYEGRLTLKELIACIERMWSDPEYSRSYNGIVDFSAVSISLDIQDFHAFMRFIKDHSSLSLGRWALVTSSPFATACSLLYKQRIFQHTLDVFSSPEAAGAFIRKITDSPPGPESQSGPKPV